MDDQTIAVSLARIETKLDALVTSASDHEGRIRFLERKGFVTGRQLWAGMLGCGTLTSTIIAAIALTR